MKKNDNGLRQIEVVCKMAERKTIHGLYFTYGLQSLASLSRDPNKLDANLISAGFRPYITLEKLNGEKETYPVTFGQ